MGSKDIADLRDQVADGFSKMENRMAEQNVSLRELVSSEVSAVAEAAAAATTASGSSRQDGSEVPNADLDRLRECLLSEIESTATGVIDKMQEQKKSCDKDIQELGELILGEFAALRDDTTEKLTALE